MVISWNFSALIGEFLVIFNLGMSLSRDLGKKPVFKILFKKGDVAGSIVFGTPV